MPLSAELSIKLTDLANLFNAPPVDPLSPAISEVLGISGFDLLMDVLHIDKRRQRSRTLVIHLPPDKAAAASAEKTKQALHRVARTRLLRERWDRRGAFRDGWRMTGLAVLLLAVCLAIASLFASDLTEGMRPLLRRTFEYGFEIVGWVILSYPLDFLILKPMLSRHRIKVLRALASIEVVIQVDEHAGRTVSSAAT